MSNITDQAFLKGKQYKTADNLQARIALHQRFSSNPYDWQRWVFDQLDIQSGKQVLEAGCGPADLWRKNLDRLATDLEVCLGDYSPGMVQTARQILGPHPIFRFTNLDVQRLPFADATFDLVIANHMLYHAADIQAALSELCRVLRPGGRLCAATNGIGHMAELMDLMRQLYPQSGSAMTQIQRFALENAPALVGEFFQDVQVRNYEDNLLVTEPEPLRDYILSMSTFYALNDAGVLDDLDRSLERIFAEQGSFFIHKSSGVILGVRGAA